MSQDTPYIPSVLVVLIARNGEPWLRDCLAGLAAQEYPRLGVVGVDAGSRDGSHELLVKALGADRVVETEPNLEAVITSVQSREGTMDADFLLLLHDDAVLEPDAILRMVEASGTSEPAGVVGLKLVDWNDPRILLDIGWSADRFGHPYSPLEEGEMDQGQYDRIHEVLFVSSAAMLVSQAALLRAGPPDRRLGFEDPELDFCWRVRLAGFHVVMTPLAVARHRDAGRRGERRGDQSSRQHRYYEERSAGVAVSKNYGLGSVWVIPIYLFIGLVKLLALLLGRRFGEAGQILAAWGWNLIRFPGTIVRRTKIQAVRANKDREIHRFMAHGSVRLRGWLDAAGRFVPGDIDLPDDEEAPQESLAERASTAARGHPVAAAWVVAFVVAALAYRPILSASQLTGGWLPSSLPEAGTFFTEFGSGFRTTVLGGAQSASPALAVWGALGGVPVFPMLAAEKLLLCVLPLAAAASAYRFCLRLTLHTVASLVAAACYSLSALPLWALSNGRIPMLAGLAVAPKLAERLDVAFAGDPPTRRLRLVIGTAAFLAFGLAFLPGLVLAVLLLALGYLLVPAQVKRVPGGALLTGAILVAGAALVLPFAIDTVTSGGQHLHSIVGVPDVAQLSRLVLVEGKASWAASWFLPLAAGLGLMLARAKDRRPAWRNLFVAASGIFLAWASAAGMLPLPLSNPGAWLVAAAVGCAALVAMGIASVTTMERRFSLSWLTSLAMIAVVGGGLLAQTALATVGTWDISENGLPAAWPLVETGAEAGERVLWLGMDDGRPFPAPGGDPSGEVDVDGTPVRYAITDREGVSLLDTGRPSWGPGYGYLEQTLAEVVSGSGRHGGALLAPLGIRFIVSSDGNLPARIRDGIERQIDLDLVPAGGLLIYRNASTWPTAAVIAGEEVSAAVRGGSPADILRAGVVAETSPLVPVEGGWDGSGDGTIWVADQFAPDWLASNGPGSSRSTETFGWAMSFIAPGGDFSVRYSGQERHTIQMWVLAVLWALILWFTRKPVRR